MSSASGRYVLVFNGEIYNHTQIRAELDKCELAPAWRGHSDTETLLASIDAYGLESTLKKLVGMFSLALYDQKTQQVYLARDRMGEKPLYYGQQGPLFFLCVRIKAIRHTPSLLRLLIGRLCVHISAIITYQHLTPSIRVYENFLLDVLYVLVKVKCQRLTGRLTTQ